MKPKYAVYPGYVRSISDGEMHYISFHRLCWLYQVNWRECVSASDHLVRIRADIRG